MFSGQSRSQGKWLCILSYGWRIPYVAARSWAADVSSLERLSFAKSSVHVGAAVLVGLTGHRMEI